MEYICSTMMFRKSAYLLVRKDANGRVIKAVGTFFKGDLVYARDQYEMEDAEPVLETDFKAKHPRLYKKVFRQYWMIFLDTYLRSLDWLDFDSEVEFDEDQEAFLCKWFTLEQDINHPTRIILNHSIFADQRDVVRLVNDLQDYVKGILELSINPVSYVSIIDQNQIYFGNRAAQRMFAEAMIQHVIYN